MFMIYSKLFPHFVGVQKERKKPNMLALKIYTQRIKNLYKFFSRFNHT